MLPSNGEMMCGITRHTCPDWGSEGLSQDSLQNCLPKTAVCAGAAAQEQRCDTSGSAINPARCYCPATNRRNHCHCRRRCLRARRQLQQRRRRSAANVQWGALQADGKTLCGGGGRTTCGEGGGLAVALRHRRAPLAVKRRQHEQRGPLHKRAHCGEANRLGARARRGHLGLASVLSVFRLAQEAGGIWREVLDAIETRCTQVGPQEQERALLRVPRATCRVNDHVEVGGEVERGDSLAVRAVDGVRGDAALVPRGANGRFVHVEADHDRPGKEITPRAQRA
mmetsp:Transcript_37766/g.88364  ORF Transcript_37766/g.88364 Transcript_37766/m.88364 type:complete len:282 (-) Transcript_37766:1705-2550(-)